ncbi:MAG: DUF374 domain-containing protein [Chlorobiaceae bacterium]|nr:DUF374 domain-containing protein [Chlorobiaceae bacterium]
MTLLPVVTRYLLPITLKLLYKSLRITVSAFEETARTEKSQILFAFWHGKMVTGWILARKIFTQSTIHAVVSLSDDGQMLSDTLSNLGFSLIRGSSSKGSNEVKAAILQALQSGEIIAITPDGPRGPVHQFKYGIVRIASEQQIPIIFASISYADAWKLKSWDSFEIPRPFSRVTITLETITVPEFNNETTLRNFSKELSERFTHVV